MPSTALSCSHINSILTITQCDCTVVILTFIDEKTQMRWYMWWVVELGPNPWLSRSRVYVLHYYLSSVCLSVYLSINLSTPYHLSAYLSIHPLINPSTHPSIIHPSFYLRSGRYTLLEKWQRALPLFILHNTFTSINFCVVYYAIVKFRSRVLGHMI